MLPLVSNCSHDRGGLRIPVVRSNLPLYIKSIFVILYLSFFIVPKTAVAQLGSGARLEQKLDDLLFEMELQRVPKPTPLDYYLIEQWNWPANLTPIYIEGDVPHYVNMWSLLYQKPTYTARFYIIFPKMKNNRHGKYKAISVLTSINCELLTYSEVAYATYDENFKRQDLRVSSMDLKFSPDQKPFQRAYVKYLCKK